MAQDSPDDRWTLTVWQTRAGRTDDFLKLWDECASWTVANQPGAVEAYLTQDAGEPLLFYSTTRWRNDEAIDIWQESARYGNFIEDANEYCDGIKPNRVRFVSRTGDGVFVPGHDGILAYDYWRTHPGREDDFAQLWQSFYESVLRDQPGGGPAFLTQDPSNEQRFFSFTRWASVADAGNLRQTPLFDGFFDQLFDICHSFSPSTVRLIHAATR